jgi:TATA-box binding protein (TBP) (component of TFIID and TFIIIB)
VCDNRMLANRRRTYHRVNCVVTVTAIDATTGDLFVPGGLTLQVLAELSASKRYQTMFSANTNRCAYPVCTVEMFSSGCILILGIQSKAAAILVGMLYCRMLSNITGRVVVLSPFKSHNEVTCGVLPSKLDIEALTNAMPLVASYTPEVYPALYLRFLDMPVFTVYGKSGQVVITGKDSKRGAVDAWNSIQWRLESYYTGDPLDGEM